MTIQRMIELLEIEHECMLRGAHNDCDRNCADCELVQDDGDLHEMYTDVIALLKEQKAKCGYWINPTSQDCHCSECGEQPVHEPGESVPLYDFCPYCGAKMEVKWND